MEKFFIVMKTDGSGKQSYYFESGNNLEDFKANWSSSAKDAKRFDQEEDAEDSILNNPEDKDNMYQIKLIIIH